MTTLVTLLSGNEKKTFKIPNVKAKYKAQSTQTQLGTAYFKLVQISSLSSKTSQVVYCSFTRWRSPLWSCGLSVLGSTWRTWLRLRRLQTVVTVRCTRSGRTRRRRKQSAYLQCFFSSFCRWWCSHTATAGWLWCCTDVWRQLKLRLQVDQTTYSSIIISSSSSLSSCVFVITIGQQSIKYTGPL